VLMTKFGMAGKIGCSDFLFRTVGFWQFQNMKKTRAKLRDLKIQGVLKQEEGLKGIKRLRWRKIKQEAESRKNWIVWFPILDGPVFIYKVESE
jgi:hypothetical protein